MVHRFDVVSVGIEYERTVVAIRILGPQARRSVVAPSSLERSCVEGVDLFTPVGRKSNVNRCASSVGGGDREVVCLFKAERNLRGAVPPRSDLGKAEGGKRATVEVTTPGEIAHANADMVDHYTAPWHFADSKAKRGLRTRGAPSEGHRRDQRKPVCDVNFPHYETGDVQISVQYLVYAIRREAGQSGREIAIFAISQGGLLSRLALTYWPDVRTKVSDVLAAAGTMHGTTVPPFANGGRCSASRPCAPAVWQQEAGSRLLGALKAQPLEAPGPTSWTTVRSATDEVVQPQTGKHPTSALRGASNILIQSVCPGRNVSHIGTAVDSVTFAAFVDAITHNGPAKVSRLPQGVCSRPYATGLDVAGTTAVLAGSAALLRSQVKNVPIVKAEPRVRSYFLRRS
jgi:triacylglycerol lipase